MNRIFINIFFELFLFIYYRENIYCCCCFKCTNIETKEEKDARLRNEQIERENALRNKLFNISCSHVGEHTIEFKRAKVAISVVHDEDNISDELKGIGKESYSILKLYPKDNYPQTEDVHVNENNFFIKHEGVEIEVKFYIIGEPISKSNIFKENHYRVYVYGKDLPSKLGIKQNGEPIIFYYSDDEKFFKVKRSKIIGENDKPVNDFTKNSFDCLKCSFVSKDCFYIDFYKVIPEYH